MNKRIAIPGAVVIIVGAVALFLFFRTGSKEYEFRFDEVSEGSILMNVTATGTINAVTTVDVGTQVSGIIAKLYADFNSVVKEGQVIAQIDPTFLQQAVKDADASLDRARAQYADAKRTAERTKVLFEKNLESQATFDASQTQLESSQAALKQAVASLDRAKINLAYATIHAPINGVVIDRKVNVGQTVAASLSSPTLYTIANDLGKMQVQTTVDESDIGKISIGQEASFTVDAYPDERFTGTVSQIRLAPVSIQNVVNYTVIIDVVNDQLKLMPGMTANVRILIGSSVDILRVPNLALRFQPPADLIDTTKAHDLRANGGVGAGEGGGGMREGGGRRWGGGDGAEGQGGDRRAAMTAIRDSIQKAHGGKLDDEGLRAEMRKVFEKMRRGAPAAPPPAPLTRTQKKKAESRFGIQNTFPEYQKSGYAPVNQITRGRIWKLNASGKLEPVRVVTGLSDGRYTEIKSSELKAGDKVVLGATLNSADQSAQGRNPLSGQGQGQRQQGGPFR